MLKGILKTAGGVHADQNIQPYRRNDPKRSIRGRTPKIHDGAEGHRIQSVRRDILECFLCRGRRAHDIGYGDTGGSCSAGPQLVPRTDDGSADTF